MSTSFSDHLLDGDHASRPAATAVPAGTLYSCSDHDLIYQSDGSVWATWATLGAVAATFSGSRVYHNADQAIATGTITALAFNTERFDTDTYHDTATNNSRLTIPSDGYYLIIGNIDWAANAAGYRNAFIRLDGATVIAADQHEEADSASVSIRQSVQTIYSFTATQYVEFCVQQNTGGNLNIRALGNYSPEFTIHKLG